MTKKEKVFNQPPICTCTIRYDYDLQGNLIDNFSTIYLL